jgi:hypothetical protein
MDLRLKLNNTIDSPIHCIYSLNEYLELRDSTIVQPYNGQGISVNEKYSLRAGFDRWEKIINTECIDKKLRIYIFHEDSVNKYSWKQLIEEKKYNKKYELSVSDLEKNNWIVTYP